MSKYTSISEAGKLWEKWSGKYDEEVESELGATFDKVSGKTWGGGVYAADGGLGRASFGEAGGRECWAGKELERVLRLKGPVRSWANQGLGQEVTKNQVRWGLVGPPVIALNVTGSR